MAGVCSCWCSYEWLQSRGSALGYCVDFLTCNDAVGVEEKRHYTSDIIQGMSDRAGSVAPLSCS